MQDGKMYMKRRVFENFFYMREDFLEKISVDELNPVKKICFRNSSCLWLSSL